MCQPHPAGQIIRHGQNVPQRENLESIKRLIDRSLQQRFKPVHPVLNLVLEFLLLLPFPFAFAFPFHIHIPIRIGIGIGISISGATAESKRGGRNGKEAVLNGFESSVNDGVDGIDDFVNERLK